MYMRSLAVVSRFSMSPLLIGWMRCLPSRALAPWDSRSFRRSSILPLIFFTLTITTSFLQGWCGCCYRRRQPPNAPSSLCSNPCSIPVRFIVPFDGESPTGATRRSWLAGYSTPRRRRVGAVSLVASVVAKDAVEQGRRLAAGG